MKQFIPIRNLNFTTQISKDEVLSNLSQNVETVDRIHYNSKGTSKTYVGNVNENNFVIRRIINYRNSFLPNIKGEFVSTISGTRIDVVMKLNNFVVVFLALWLSGIFVACIYSTYSILIDGFAVASLIPFFMLIFAIIILQFAFNFEVKRSIKDLEKIFCVKTNQ